MLQAPEPDDYVVATGEAHSVREFLDVAAACCELDWKKFVESDARYFRPTEVDALLGDCEKARRILGWQPRVTFVELIRMMVAHDIDLARRERTVKQAGFADGARGAAITGED